MELDGTGATMAHSHGLILAVVMLSFAGCQPAPAPPRDTTDQWVRYNLSFFDDNTQLIAAGEINLPRTWPPVGQRFTGSWRVKSAAPSFPLDATRDGTYSGYVDSRSISIDLNPGATNHNVMLSTDPAREVLDGNWIVTNLGGGKPMGKFTLTQ
jgi:hypothetical protein